MARERKLPSPTAPDRDQLQDYLRRAGASRETRRAEAAQLRQWYERGTVAGTTAVYNKLRSHIDRLGSYLWSPESVRFALHLPPAVRQAWLPAASVARDEFRQVWADSGADEAVNLAMEWALVYGATALKVYPTPATGFAIGYIEPWDLGMSREDQGGLEDQDIIVHWYTYSLPQFERWVTGHPRETELVALARERATTPGGGGGSQRLVISGITGAFPQQQVSGGFPEEPVDSMELAEPMVVERVLQLADIWIRHRFHNPLAGMREGGEDYEDWEVTTVIADGGPTPLLTRRNPILPRVRAGPNLVLPGELPFVLLAPSPLPSYAWGRSLLLALIRLQTWREEHVQAMRDVIRSDLDPPKFFIGISDFEEAGRALSTPGGEYGSPEPTAKVEALRPQLGQESFGMLDRIDAMFADQSGLPPITQGEPQPNVRGQSQLAMAAGIGAGRIRRLALQVEKALASLATLAFRVLVRSDSQAYPLGPDASFLLAQLPPGLTLSVSAHSASPIFAEQAQAKAVALQRAGAIDGPWFVELLDPPYREELKTVAAARDKARGEQQEKLLQIQAERLARRGTPGPKPGRPSGG